MGTPMKIGTGAFKLIQKQQLNQGVQQKLEPLLEVPELGLQI